MPPTLEKPQEREHSLCSVVSLNYGRWTEVDHQLNSSQMQQSSQFALHQNFSEPIDISRLMSLRMWDKISTVMLHATYLLQFWEQEHLTVYHFILTEMFVSIQLPLIGILCYEILPKNCEQ